MSKWNKEKKKSRIDRTRESKSSKFIPKEEFRYYGDEIFIFYGNKCCLIVYP